MPKLLVLGILAGILGTAGIAAADSNIFLNVPAHRHYVVDTSGKSIEVGPRLCDDANLQKAFNQFHANTHSHHLRNGAYIGATGPIAPGLHNDIGAELRPGDC